MNWTIDRKNKAKRQLKALDRQMKERVEKELDDAATSGNPRENGKALKGNYAGRWAYRVGDYRVVVELNDANKVIKMVEVEPRGRAYRRRKLHRIAEDGGDWLTVGDGDDDRTGDGVRHPTPNLC